MLLSILFFVMSIYYFIKFIGQVFLHDVGAKVNDDYHSNKRGKQRSKAIGTFFKSVLCFFAAGFAGFMFM